MAQLSCPGCGATLAVQDADAVTGLSCPRCLAPLGSPGTGIRATAPASTSVTESAPALRLAAPGLDLDVHHDAKRGFGCLTILIALTVVGIVLTVVTPKGRNTAANEGNYIAALLLMALLFGILDLLVIIKIGIWLKHRSSPIAPGTVGQGFVKAVAVVFAFLALAAAVVVFFFFACLGVVWRW